MSARLEHRGPDDDGTWSDPDSGIGLGFRRLAIIDLTENGHQPMCSSGGRYVIVFNGEVYNYQEIAAELRSGGARFRGHSDTEVILHAFEKWGVEDSVRRFVGMFAMAVWDARDRTLHLLRDRLGIKPLYVYRANGVIGFASELKSLRAIPGFRPEIDVNALAMYFRYLYVPAPHSIYSGVQKLLPGHIITLNRPDATDAARPFWSLSEVAARGMADPFLGSPTEAVDSVEHVLRDAVRLRMRSDVPVGAFLSGGVDSSTVVSLMQECSARPVRTFAVSFDSSEHDESAEAAAVARHLGTNHETLRLSGDDALDLISDLPRIFDEPLADPSELPTILICRAARQCVTVAVSGDGGDELFVGYNRYTHGSRTIRRATSLPALPRRLVAAGLWSIAPSTWDKLGKAGAPLLGEHRLVGEKAHKLAHLLRQSDDSQMYVSLLSAWRSSPLQGQSGLDGRATPILATRSMSLINRMLLTDQTSYLPDDLLAKVDRASMAVSLEVRVPILDHRVVELSWRMPEHMHLADGRGKWLLRQVLQRYVPATLTDRPKMGFSVPLADWLRGPLRAWASDHLHADRLGDMPGLDVARVRRVWHRFLSGASNDHSALWAVLMFQAWREQWKS